MREINEIKNLYNNMCIEFDNIDKITKKKSDNIKEYNNYVVNHINDITRYSTLDNINNLKFLSKIRLQEKRGIKLFDVIKPKREKKLEECILNINKNVEEINKNIETIRDSIYIKNRSELIEIEQFVIRRFFIYYLMNLIYETENLESEEIQSVRYNIEEFVSEVKNNRESWIFSNNSIKSTIEKILNSNMSITSKSKVIIENIVNIEKSEIIKSQLVLNFYSDKTIKSNIDNNEDILKLNDKIDEIIFRFTEFLQDIDLKNIDNYFMDISVYKSIIKLLGYEEMNLMEKERLQLDKCKTIDVQYTDDIAMDFLIKEVYRDGYVKDSKVIRRAMVSVYRYEDEEV